MIRETEPIVVPTGGKVRLARIGAALSSWPRTLWREVKRNPLRYVLVSPGLLYFAVFCYVPMWFLIVAFKDYRPYMGVAESPWVGLANFTEFFSSIYFLRLIRNSVLINAYSLVFGFPVPIILALLLNEVRHAKFKRVVQSLSYLPHFISTVVVVGMIVNFLNVRTGFVNQVIGRFGGKQIPFLSRPEWFRPMYVGSGIWQNAGWGSIVYLAALAGIDPTLYEAAVVDGASHWQQVRHVSLPGIMPIIVVMLILNLGRMMSVGFEKVYLLYSPSTYETADVIATYVYRAGLIAFRWGFGTAVGLFNGTINLLLLVIFNRLARRTEYSLW